MNKLLGSLIGAISKMIHELTEDTRNLCDIKCKLTEEHEENEFHFSQLRKSTQTSRSIQKDMPL
jgi:hypothetical protein